MSKDNPFLDRSEGRDIKYNVGKSFSNPDPKEESPILDAGKKTKIGKNNLFYPSLS